MRSETQNANLIFGFINPYHIENPPRYGLLHKSIDLRMVERIRYSKL